MSIHDLDPHPRTPNVPYSVSGSISHYERRHRPILPVEAPRQMPTHADPHPHTPDIPHSASGAISHFERGKLPGRHKPSIVNPRLPINDADPHPHYPHVPYSATGSISYFERDTSVGWQKHGGFVAPRLNTTSASYTRHSKNASLFSPERELRNGKI